MKVEQINDIDLIFRDRLGNISEIPPPKIWTGLRIGLIERKLVIVENQNYWLKIGSGLLSAAVIVLLGLLYKSKSMNVAEIVQSEKIVFRDKLLSDTIYVSKTEKVYIPVKEYIYLDQKHSQETSNNKTVLTKKTIEDDKNVTTNQVENNYSQQNIQHSIIKDSQEFQLNMLNENNKLQHPFILEKRSVNDNLTDFIPQKNTNEVSKRFDANTQNTTKLSLEIKSQLLNFKGFDTLKIFAKFPDINYQNRFVFRRVMKQDEKISFKNPSIKLFYAPESAYVSMLSDGSLIAETIGTEKNHNVYSYGANINFELSDKWSIETGLGFSHSQFKTDNAVKKRPLIAEMYKGTPQFLYRTALGLAIIPINDLHTKPVVGSNIMIESEDTHTLKQLRVPLLIKYKFFDNHRMFGVYTNQFNLYSIMGAELRINRSQILNAEIYEPDGTDFYTSFTSFQEVKPYNVGMVLGAGFEYNLARKINFYLEPTIRLSTSSFTQSTIVQSFPRWWSFAFGFQYNLK